jgi:hypothetical protein
MPLQKLIKIFKKLFFKKCHSCKKHLLTKSTNEVL